MRWSCVLFVFALLNAQSVGTVRGIVHDPQHRPIPDATVTLRGQAGTWSKTGTSNSNGEFTVADVPEGQATITVTAAGLENVQQPVTVGPGETPVLHLQLALASVK